MDPEPRDGEVHVLPVRDNVYMLVGDGGNIVVQTGDQGAFVVDTGEGKLADKVLAAIRSLTSKPIQFIANTSFQARAHGRQRRAGRRRPGPEPAGIVLRAGGAARRHRLLQRSAERTPR